MWISETRSSGTPASNDESFPTVQIDGNVAPDVRVSRRDVLVLEAVVADPDRRCVAEAIERFDRRRMVVAMDHVGRELEVVDPRHDMDTLGHQLVGKTTGVWCVHGDVVAATTHAERQVADHDLRAGAMVQLDVGEQDPHGVDSEVGLRGGRSKLQPVNGTVRARSMARTDAGNAVEGWPPWRACISTGISVDAVAAASGHEQCLERVAEVVMREVVGEGARAAGRGSPESRRWDR